MPPFQRLPLTHFYKGRILNFAHRGAAEEAPENTLPAFLRAADEGADGVELDARLSADGVPVVIHNVRVDKTTNGTGSVAEKTLEELRELDAGRFFSEAFAGTRIPTLEEVFEATGNRLYFNVELKHGGEGPLVQNVIDVIKAHGMQDRVLLSSFNPLLIREVKRLAPELPTGYIYAPDLPLPLAKGWLARPLAGKHEARHPHFSMVDADYMQWAHRRGYRVNVWTVNEADDIRRMRDLGVDMIMSDRPDLVQDILQGEL